MKWLLLPTMLLLLASCTIGSSTTQRSALPRPAIEPDGALWDAVTVARRHDAESFRFLLSPQMIYRALYPEAKLDDVTSQKEFDTQRAEIEAELLPQEQVVNQLAQRYMGQLEKLVTDRFIEVSKPSYTIKYKDEFERAAGPNRARVVVTIYPKTHVPEDYEPETIEVRFIQDGRRWLIDGLTNDKLKGAFVR
ncbi:MAG: hypothetical protein H6839_06700 [Planctomycetes bacterium]|nr:hypothetical protein [Planctomycetota bacterium]